MTNIILSIIFIIAIIIYKIIINKKYKINKETIIYKKSKKLIKILYIISIIIFILEAIIVFILEGLSKNIIYIPLCISILSLPLSIDDLYKIFFKEDEELIYINKIITKIKPTTKQINMFRRAGIKITNDKALLKDNTSIEENKDLDILYERIMNSRHKNDIYLTTIKYNIVTYIPIIIMYILLPLVGFPFEYYLSFTLLLKIYTITTSHYFYKYIPYDKDNETRLPKPVNQFIEKQELLFSVIEIILFTMILCITYMYLLIIDATVPLLNTIIITMIIYGNIFYTLIHFSERALFINIIKAIKNIRFIIYLIISFIITTFVYYIHIYGTIKMGIQNYLSSIMLAFIFSISYELVKLARFTTVRGVKKNGNNKKHKRSKSNNS